MRIAFAKSFVKDIAKLRNAELADAIDKANADIKAATSPAAIPGIRKLKGWESYWRIRVGEYRMGLRIEGEEVLVVRFLHRKDVYRAFP